MVPVSLLSCAIFAPVLCGGLGLLLPRAARGLRVMLAVLGPVASLVALGMYLSQYGVSAGAVGGEWMPQFRMDYWLRADELGLFFAFLVSGIGLLITLYARAYFGPDNASLYRFFPSLHLFMTAMMGVALADSFMLLLLFWELTSISSFLLIGWERDDRDAVRNALQAFIITGLGGLCLMAGLILIGLVTGAWTFSALDAYAATIGLPRTGGMVTAGLVLVFAGAAAKSAQWPLHVWLPGAMAAPTPVSAYLHSATMVKAGVYLVGRLWMVLSPLPLFAVLVITIGAITMVLGAYIALRKSDLKQIFAYTTVSQLGLLMCMYGLAAYEFEGEPNLIWDITQILNHALYKAPLFIVAGAIAHLAHTRELPELRGLLWRGGSGTIMALIMILAAYALAAGPFTLSFAAKEMFLYQIWHAYEATHQTGIKFLAGAAIAVAALNVAIFVRLTRVLVARPPAYAPYHHEHVVPEEDIDYDPHDSGVWPAMLWIPAALIVALQYLGGLAPGAFEALLGPMERTRIYFEHLPSTLELSHWGPPLMMSLTGSAIGLLIGFAPVFRPVIGDVHTRLFPAFYKLAVDGGGRVFGVFQTGYLRTYITLMALALVLLFAWTLFRTESIGGLRGYVQLPDDLGLTNTRILPGYLLAALMCLAAVLMPMVSDRAARILVLGVAGTAATAIFYIYEAPDLALTQISIEVVSLILFLLVLALLPETKLRRQTRLVGRVPLAIGVGLVMGLLTLAATTGQRPPRVTSAFGGPPMADLGEFFLRNSYVGRDTLGLQPEEVRGGLVDRGPGHPESFGTHPPMTHDGPVHLHKGGGGANVVNVILVDFRGFDTLGEITVLGLAALGVWTLFRRHRGDVMQGAEIAVEQAPPFVRVMNTTILLQAARIVVPLSILVAVYIYYKGHQSPGGGFVGGLVASVALILFRISACGPALRKLLPVPERVLIAVGLSCAALSGAGALAMGLPFLTSNNGYLPLPPPLEPWHWATVMIFDAGVFLVVVGVTVGMIDTLSRELERRRTEETAS